MTYEYQCTNPDCLHSWETEQAISEPRHHHCPKCEQPTARRLVSGGLGFILRGSGWSGDGYGGKGGGEKS